MSRQLVTFLLLLGSLAPVQVRAESIQWQQWGKPAFEQARSQDRMIILDVGMEGCTACRWMDEITYTDQRVIELINRHFVAIVADAEAQPDIGERYSDWAWPATIFMAPDGTQVLALAGNRRPDNFIPILEELVTRQANDQLQADRLAPYAAAAEPTSTDLTRIRDTVRGQLDASLNEQYGGWSRHGVSTASGARVEHLYLRAHMYSNAELQKLALLTTDAYLRAIDPVWGGVFVQAFHDNGARPERFARLGAVPEKRLPNQADALTVFAHAYRITREPAYLQGIEAVDRFLREWMSDPDGSFYTSQEDQAPQLPADMTAIDYWLLPSDAQRRQYGIPPIDHAVYTDKNAEVISAYAKAYEATRRSAYLEVALRAAGALNASRRQAGGWILQSTQTARTSDDRRMRPLVVEKKPLLSAQAWYGSALLSLYRVTGDDAWLSQARQLADAMLNLLYDKDKGGFYATAQDDSAPLLAPRKPLELNARAAHFFYDLWILSKDERYAAVPERTLRAVALPGILEREGKIVGQTALALEKLTAAYVEFSVVGEPGKAATRELFEAGINAYHPRKLLHYEKAGRYPQRERPAMYICNPDRCSIPIYDPAVVARQADSFRSAASFSP